MKKIFLITLLMSMVITANAQFVLTFNGFKDKNDLSRNYVVFKIEDVSKEDMYNRVLKYVTQTYRSSKDVVSKHENEVITINAYEPKQIHVKALKYDIHYTIVLSFKDGKIKIDSPDFECTTFSLGSSYRLTMTGSNGGLGKEVTVGLFKKNGEPSQKRSIEELESFFNNFSNAIVIAVKGKANTEEW